MNSELEVLFYFLGIMAEGLGVTYSAAEATKGYNIPIVTSGHYSSFLSQFPNLFSRNINFNDTLQVHTHYGRHFGYLQTEGYKYKMHWSLEQSYR